MRHPTLLATSCAAALTLVAGHAAADAYDDAFAASAVLEAEGRLDEAARALEEVLPLYPQDFTLPLQIAWLHLRRGRFATAELYYRTALTLSPRSAEATLGLAAALERQGRCPEARPLYEGVAEDRPDLAEARAGAVRCTPPPAFRVTMDLSGTGLYYPDHPVKAMAGGGTFSALFAHRSGFFFGGAYRYTRFAPTSDSGIDAWGQHEAHASLGYSDPLGGFTAHYAFVNDGSGALNNSHHVGFTARFSPFGDIELRGSASFYDDMKVFRLEPSWRIPIVFGLSVRPGFAVARAGDQTSWTGMGTLAFDHRMFSLWAGGKFGTEVRPVYWNAPVVYDIPETIAFGAWAGASVNVSDDVRIHLSYAMDRLQQASGTASSAHALTLGVAVSF